MNLPKPYELTPPGALRSPTETDNMEGFKAYEDIHKFIQTSPDYHIHPLDWDLATFGGEQYSQYGSFSSDVTAKIKEVIASKDDVATVWAAFVNEMMPKMKPVINELNANLK